MLNIKLKLETIKKFNELYKIEKKKIPYHLNIIDDIGANENAHSKILYQLLRYKKSGSYVFFELFLKRLGDEFSKLSIKKPEFSAEKYRIDVLVKDFEGKYAIIIENKIHYAIDQSNQIVRYINQLKSLGFEENRIYVIYLSRSGGSPSNESISKEEIKALAKRYKEISFQFFILPWVENELLPICMYTDTTLLYSIQLYIDHLKGLFNKRTIEMKMEKKLKEEIKNVLELNKSQIENLNTLHKELESIERFQTVITNMHNELIANFFEEKLQILKEKYPDEKIKTNIDYQKSDDDNIICEKPDGKYFYLGIELTIEQKKVLCAIGSDNYMDMQPYYGITIRGCTDEKEEDIIDYVKENQKLSSFTTTRWYSHQRSTYELLFKQYLELLNYLISKHNNVSPSKN